MASGFTRRHFLRAFGAAAFLGLTNAVSCAPLERTRKLRSLRTPKASPERLPEVRPLQDTSSAPVGGVWVFRSRPDLSPPAVEVAIRAHDDTAPGYIFVAPEEGGSGQGGSMVFDDRGEVVWFRPLSGRHGRAMNFEVQTYRGRDVLTWGETAGEYVICDSSYREIARLSAGHGYDGDHHEFLISPQDTALITIYNSVPQDLTAVGGSKNGRAWQGIVQELDIETGEVLFEWRSIDHVGLEETYVDAREDHYAGGIDYFHINSIDVDHDDNLLISARETSAVYKIDRKSGEVIWRLGGKKSDFEMGEGARFAFQHDARRLPDGTISIFDNGSLVFEDGIPRAVEESRAIVLELDERKMTASLVREYTHPDEQHADAAGNLQMLANGDAFVGWGRALAISEFGKDGGLLFDARLPSNNRSYRAFRLPWRGYPTDRPAAVAERISEEVEVYASWNGATEVESWEVLTGQRPDGLEPLGSVPRDGFETAILARSTEPYVAVRARDHTGRILGTSELIEPVS